MEYKEKERRIVNSLKKLETAQQRLQKERAIRIMVENNPKINVLNYWYYRLRWRKYVRSGEQQ